jgi:hypothetical protein
MALELPAVGTSAALADGPGVVLSAGVGSLPVQALGDGLPVVPRASMGYLAGPTDDALLLGAVVGGSLWAGDPSVFAAEGRLTGAVGSPQRTVWVGGDLGVGVQRREVVVPQVSYAGTLAVDLDPLTTVTLRLGASAAEVVTPRLGLGVVYRPSPKSHVAIGSDVGRTAEVGAARYPTTAHAVFGGRVGRDVLPAGVDVPDPARAEGPFDPRSVVDVVEHPMLRCPEGTLSTGRPPPLGREAYCVRAFDADTVVRDGPFVRWHDAEHLAEAGSYRLGKRTGAWTRYAHDGKVREVGTFDDDLEQGDWITFFADGTPEEEAVMVEGELHGPWRLFRSDGSLAVEGTYEEGVRTGVWLDFDEEGTAVRERIYVDGRLTSQRELEPEEGDDGEAP